MKNILRQIPVIVLLMTTYCSAPAIADLVLGVEYTGLTGGGLDGGTVLVETTIQEGDTWNMKFLNNAIAQEHDGLVLAKVTGTASADGIYAYQDILAGFNVATTLNGGNGTLFSISDQGAPASNNVTVSNGLASLIFRYEFNLPNDDGIVFGEPILQSQLPPIASTIVATEAAYLEYNNVQVSFENVRMLGALTVVPEPSSLLMLGIAGTAALITRRRNR